MIWLLINIINQIMSDLEGGKYPWREVIYHTDAGTVLKVINASSISILEAVLDDEYVLLIKSVSFILDKLKNDNYQTVIKLYDREFLYVSSSDDGDFETKRKRAPKFITAGCRYKKKINPSNSTTFSKETSNRSNIITPKKSRTDGKCYPSLAQLGDLVTSRATELNLPHTLSREIGLDIFSLGFFLCLRILILLTIHGLTSNVVTKKINYQTWTWYMWRRKVCCYLFRQSSCSYCGKKNNNGNVHMINHFWNFCFYRIVLQKSCGMDVHQWIK